MSPGPTNGTDILRLSLSNGSVDVTIGTLAFLVLAMIGTALVVTYFVRASSDRVVTVNVVVPFTGGQLSLARDRQVARIAHQAWVELMTRKAGQPFDETSDVVEEVFNSWYQLFGELRTLAKSVPAESLGTGNSRRMTELLVEALNSGLRPPLTRWQARFRAWYDLEKGKRPGQAPQDIQRDFPDYAAMLEDIKSTNAGLLTLAASLRAIERGRGKDGNARQT